MRLAGNGNNYVFTVIGLPGTAPGVGATAAAPGGATVDLTTTAANSLVIFNIGMGGGNTADTTTAPNSPAGAVKIAGIALNLLAFRSRGSNVNQVAASMRDGRGCGR